MTNPLAKAPLSSTISANADPVPAGRYAHLAPPTIVKSGPDYPKLPSSSPWSGADLVLDEPLIDQRMSAPLFDAEDCK
jgi:hypothetical protein